MSKVSLLALVAAADVDGSETVLIVKAGKNRRASLNDLTAPTLAGMGLLRDQAADLVDPANIFTDVALATAEAAVAEGTTFKLVDTAAKTVSVRERTAGGSDELYQEATAAALRSPVPGYGVDLLANVAYPAAGRAALAQIDRQRFPCAILIEDGGLFFYRDEDLQGDHATADLTFSGTCAAGDYLVIDGWPIAFVAAGAVGAQVNVGASAAETAQNVKAYINANSATLRVTATGAAETLALQAAARGLAGNNIPVRWYSADIAMTFGGNAITRLDGGTMSVEDDPLQAFWIAPAADPSGASGAWQRVCDKVTPEHFGALGSITAAGVVDETAQLQAFFRFLGTGIREGRMGARYWLASGTLAAQNTFALEALRTTVFFDPGTYRPALRRTNQPNTAGLGVAFDGMDAGGSTVEGYLRIAARAAQAAPLSDVIAYTYSAHSSTGRLVGGSWNFGATLQIEGFGYGLYQPDMNEGTENPNILPYTRSAFGNVEFRFCDHPFRTGLSGNALDEATFKALRFSRNREEADLQKTTLVADAIFLDGKAWKDDTEEETASITAGNTAVTLSAAGTWQDGDCIAFIDVAGGDLGYTFASRIASGAGTANIVIEDAPDQTLAGLQVVRLPRYGLRVRNQAGLISARLYVEGLHYIPVAWENGSNVDVTELEVSDGEWCAWQDAAIVSLNARYGRLSCNIRNFSTKTQNYIYLSTTSWKADGSFPERVVRVNVPSSLERVGADVLRFGPPPAIHQSGFYDDESVSFIGTNDSVKIACADGEYTVHPQAGAMQIVPLEAQGPNAWHDLSASYVLDRTETAAGHTNADAVAAIGIKLPSFPRAGERRRFMKVADYQMRIYPPATAQIVGGNGFDLGMYLGAVGDTATLVARSKTEWAIESYGGVGSPSFEV